MQGEILLVNPTGGELASNPRRRRKHRARGPGGRFVKTHRAKRTNARRHRRRNPVAALANPRRRRRRRNPVAAFAANPRRRRHHRARARRRNPRFALAGGSLTKQLVQAGLGGLGAVAVDAGLAAVGNLPMFPEALKTGPLKSVSRIVGALGVGWLVGKVKPAWRTPVTAGALAVTAYFVARDLVAQFAPQIPLQGYMEGDVQLGYIDPAPALQGTPGSMGAYMQPPTVGAYMEPGMGDYNNDGM